MVEDSSAIRRGLDSSRQAEEVLRLKVRLGGLDSSRQAEVVLRLVMRSGGLDSSQSRSTLKHYGTSDAAELEPDGLPPLLEGCPSTPS